MLNQRRFLVGAVVIAVAVGWLVYAGIRSTSMYYFNIEEFLSIREAHAGEYLRVHGWVKAGSIKWDPETNHLAFELAPKEGAAAVPVTYSGVLPDMFAEGREVVVEADYTKGTLAAKQIMTSCPSKYEPKPGEQPAAQGS